MQRDRSSEKGMGTAIIPPGNPTPILDPPEHDLDFVPPAGEGFVVAASCRSVLQGGDALIGTIATVGNQLFRLGKTGQQASRTSVIAGGPCGQQQMHRLAGVVAHGVQLRVRAIVRAANTAGDGHFWGRLAAVRWAFRWVESIIRQSLVPGGHANSRKILWKIPARLQRTNRL